MPVNFASPALRIGIAILAILLIIGAVQYCTSSRQRVAQSKQDTRSATALAETAKEAAATVIAQADDEATVDQLVAATTLEIENAPNDQAAGDAARRAICRMPDFRNDPACRVLSVHP